VRIKFVGKPQNKKLTKGLLREAVNFYLDLLNLSSKIKRKIHLTIDFTQKLYTNEVGSLGAVVFDLSDPAPRNFEMCLYPKMGYRPTLSTLGHETVHLEQLATGRRYNFVRAENIVRWEGKNIDELKVDYWDSPWEIEAHGKEVGMYVRFKKHLKEKDGFRTRKKKAT
jgi:hypothetical protein